jgi:hypothetical protein
MGTVNTNIRIPESITRELDILEERNGFTNRTQQILHTLKLGIALEQSTTGIKPLIEAKQGEINLLEDLYCQAEEREKKKRVLCFEIVKMPYLWPMRKSVSWLEGRDTYKQLGITKQEFDTEIADIEQRIALGEIEIVPEQDEPERHKIIIKKEVE